MIAAQVDARFVAEVKLFDLSVFRDIDHDGARPAGPCDVISPRDRSRNLGSLGDLIVPFRDGHRHADRVGLLKRVRAEQCGGNLPRDADDRRRVEHRIGYSGDEIRRAGTGGGQTDAHLACRTGVALRRVYGALFVTRQDVVQPVGMMVQMIVDRNDLSAGITEDRIGSLGDERQQQRFRSLYFLLVSHKSIGFDGVGRPPAGGAVGDGGRPRMSGARIERGMVFCQMSSRTPPRSADVTIDA